jgi:hypothetical protein
MFGKIKSCEIVAGQHKIINSISRNTISENTESLQYFNKPGEKYVNPTS